MTEKVEPRRSLLSRILGPALVTVGITGVILGFALSNSGSTDIRVEGNPVIEALFPEPDAEVLRQTSIGIDLIAGYEAELTINGVPIPPDQINVLRDLENPRESAQTSGTFGSTLNRFRTNPSKGEQCQSYKVIETALLQCTGLSQMRLLGQQLSGALLPCNQFGVDSILSSCLTASNGSGPTCMLLMPNSSAT